MIIGVGIDICQNSRIGKLYEKYDRKFLEKIYMPEEIEYCLGKKNPVPHLTARFAFKEAFIKATKKNLGNYKEIGLVGDFDGAKTPNIQGRAKKVLHDLGVDKVECSISHEKQMSAAIVILEADGK